MTEFLVTKLTIIGLLPTVMSLPPLSLKPEKIRGLSWDLENVSKK